MNKEDAYFEAMRTRDHRFDGKFFVGVKTTGIYCRPICPAKPKRQNVEFFTNHFMAERAGYRPCLRCRPESAPRSMAWIGKSAIVRRAVKMLNHPDALAFDEDRFAARFGVSARHLRRVFVDEIGKTPKQLGFENRLNLARQLITETALPVTEIAFASGFGSVRRFNDAFLNRFKRSPSQIRRHHPSGSGAMTVSLAYRPPFDYWGLLNIYKSHQTGELEWFEDGKMYRVISFNGKTGKIVIRDDPKRSRLLLDFDFPDAGALPEVIARVRAMFDLDSDPLVVANALESDTSIKKLLRKYPGIRLPSGWDGFETAVAAILGQLVSVQRGRALVCDLINMLGEETSLDGRKIRLFPAPHSIAGSDLKGLKTTGARKQTLNTFAEMVAAGAISLDPSQDVGAFSEKLLGVRGIGPWTANYMALKVLRHTDALPDTDLILARALPRYSKRTLAKMSPWRGYLAALLWREHSQKLKTIRRTK